MNAEQLPMGHRGNGKKSQKVPKSKPVLNISEAACELKVQGVNSYEKYELARASDYFEWIYNTEISAHRLSQG